MTNFRSAEDSEEFEIDSVTCLVGKNESGKTAVLLALSALNPHEATPFSLNRERDYPRRNLVLYNEKHGEEGGLVVETFWELEESEPESIAKEVGDETLKNLTEVRVSRRYDQPVEVDANLDWGQELKHLYDKFSLDAIERTKLGSPPCLQELLKRLDGLDARTDKHFQLRDYLRNGHDLHSRVTKCVVNMLPTFMYISSYDRMEGAIQIENTQRLIDGNEIGSEEHKGVRLFVEFLDYAKIPISDITQVNTYESFNAKLQAASNRITDQIFEYWSQNSALDVEVRIDSARKEDAVPFNEGTIARARIKNNLHRVDTPFSERSAGFVWFFSFFVKFTQIEKTDGQVILLLDEPGLSLHGKAQADLLRFIDERLAPKHQVIYSTHSPFMVPGDKLERVRTVEDKVDLSGSRPKVIGTKVSHDVLMVDSDTLFPLQGALGYEATQSLFVGKQTLLVEGPSDILYLQVLSDTLAKRERISLDPRWTICPAGGIDKMMPFISLFAGKDLQVAVLSDAARGTKNKVDKIIRSQILKAGHFFTIANFLDRDEADIEDIFETGLYAELVNNCYDLPEKYKVTVSQLEEIASTDLVVKKVEKLFRVMPNSIKMYNHYAPAAWLLRNPDFLDDETDAIERTLKCAEEMIKTYNSLLS